MLLLIDRTSGDARRFIAETLQAKDTAPILRENIAKETRIVTDEAVRYIGHSRIFDGHVSVNHSKNEYANRDDRSITTNHVEGYFSVSKHGLKGTYRHCAKQHMHGYFAQFDFGCSNRVKLGVDDAERAEQALKGIMGKRLSYPPVRFGDKFTLVGPVKRYKSPP